MKVTTSVPVFVESSEFDATGTVNVRLSSGVTISVREDGISFYDLPGTTFGYHVPKDEILDMLMTYQKHNITVNANA